MRGKGEGGRIGDSGPSDAGRVFWAALGKCARVAMVHEGSGWEKKENFFEGHSPQDAGG